MGKVTELSSGPGSLAPEPRPKTTRCTRLCTELQMPQENTGLSDPRAQVQLPWAAWPRDEKETVSEWDLSLSGVSE